MKSNHVWVFAISLLVLTACSTTRIQTTENQIRTTEVSCFTMSADSNILVQTSTLNAGFGTVNCSTDGIRQLVEYRSHDTQAIRPSTGYTPKAFVTLNAYRREAMALVWTDAAGNEHCSCRDGNVLSASPGEATSSSCAFIANVTSETDFATCSQ